MSDEFYVVTTIEQKSEKVIGIFSNIRNLMKHVHISEGYINGLTKRLKANFANVSKKFETETKMNIYANSADVYGGFILFRIKKMKLDHVSFN